MVNFIIVIMDQTSDASSARKLDELQTDHRRDSSGGGSIGSRRWKPSGGNRYSRASDANA
jgi:hypothetical protein